MAFCDYYTALNNYNLNVLCELGLFSVCILLYLIIIVVVVLVVMMIIIVIMIIIIIIQYYYDWLTDV